MIDKTELLEWLRRQEAHSDECQTKYAAWPLHGPYYLGRMSMVRDVIAHLNGEPTAFDKFLGDYAKEE